MSSIGESRVAKLRASCDACNESKVRCSQTKPKCARCDKQGIHCIYGLSRRSHKNAPRIGASHESAHAAVAEAVQSPPTSSEHAGRGRSMTAPTTMSPSGTGDEPRGHGQGQGQARAQTAQLSGTDPALSSLINMQSPSDRLYEDLSSLSRDSHHADFSLVSEPVDMSAGFDFLDHSMAGPSLDCAGIHPGFMDYDPPPDMEGKESVVSAACNCVARLVDELGSLHSSSSGDGRSSTSFDAQLSRLRRAINVSADCLSCHCNTQDEMSIMTISLLIGRVIQSLDLTLIRATSSSTPSFSRRSSPSYINIHNLHQVPTSTSTSITASASTSTSTSASTSASALSADSAPRLSWGSLQIDPHEEEQLKQHLWLLQFRKLERVIEEFSQSVGRLPAGQSAYLMACRCLHMWLTQKAEVLRARYQAQDAGRGIASW
ncbi:hypothetical protein BDW72DRAFT_38406 [Aspergillus terricola var. indicus]